MYSVITEIATLHRPRSSSAVWWLTRPLPMPHPPLK